MAIKQDIGASGVVELADRILDRSIVTDAWIRASLVGIELLAVEARVICTGVETFLKYAKAVDFTPTHLQPGTKGRFKKVSIFC